MKKLVGIYGGMGCGKSTVSATLRALGANVLDADEINAQLVHSTTYRRAVAALCPDAVVGDRVDKSALRRWVLEDEANRQALMQVAHPLIAAEIVKRTAQGLWFVEFSVYVPNLVPVDVAWHVVCAKESQYRRILARGGWTQAEASVLVAAQNADGVAPADSLIIPNDGTREQLVERVSELYRALL